VVCDEDFIPLLVLHIHHRLINIVRHLYFVTAICLRVKWLASESNIFKSLPSLDVFETITGVDLVLKV